MQTRSDLPYYVLSKPAEEDLAQTLQQGAETWGIDLRNMPNSLMMPLTFWQNIPRWDMTESTLNLVLEVSGWKAMLYSTGGNSPILR